jgi:hypothetical protein
MQLAAQHATTVYPQKDKMASKLNKAADEKFRKRKNNIVKKGDELRLLCEADVFILLHRKGRYYTYKSTDQPSWPPTLEKIIRTVEMLLYYVPNTERYAGPKLSSTN